MSQFLVVDLDNQEVCGVYDTAGPGEAADSAVAEGYEEGELLVFAVAAGARYEVRPTAHPVPFTA